MKFYDLIQHTEDNQFSFHCPFCTITTMVLLIRISYVAEKECQSVATYWNSSYIFQQLQWIEPGEVRKLWKLLTVRNNEGEEKAEEAQRPKRLAAAQYVKLCLLGFLFLCSGALDLFMSERADPTRYLLSLFHFSIFFHCNLLIFVNFGFRQLY